MLVNGVLLMSSRLTVCLKLFGDIIVATAGDCVLLEMQCYDYWRLFFSYFLEETNNI